MRNQNTKVLRTLVAFSSATILATFSNSQKIHAETLEISLEEQSELIEKQELETTDISSENDEQIETEDQLSDPEEAIDDTPVEEIIEEPLIEEAEKEIHFEIDPVYENQESITGILDANHRIQVIINNEDVLEVRSTEEGTFEFVIPAIEKDDVLVVSVLSESDKVLVSQEIEVREEVNEEPMPLIVEPFDTAKNELHGFGQTGFIIRLINEKEEVISEKVIDENGLFLMEVPSDLSFKQLYLEYLTVEEEFLEKIEIMDIPKKEESKVETAVPVVEEEKEEPIKTSTYAVTAQAKVPEGKTYYYIQSGDTINSLAKHFKVSANDLTKWNNITNQNSIYVGQLISVDGTNVYDKINKENKKFNTSADFIKFVSDAAMRAAKEKNLYTSVMIAQAALETGYGDSALSTIGNNFFGIKGTYNGNSIVMRTWEETANGEVIWINAYFRLYPSYYESMLDNASLLRDGNWDKEFYKGTWVENTTSYKDATKWLTGRYATDSSYGTKLNNIIEYWNLTQYDKHVNHFDKILSSRNTDYQAKIVGKNYPLATNPIGTEGAKEVSSSTNYVGKTYKIVKETVTEKGTFVQLKIGNQYLWMNKAGVQPEAMSNTKNVNYQAKINRKGDTLNTLPWGIDGFKSAGYTDSFVGQTVYVIQETTTPRATWAKIKVNGQQLWVDITALTPETMSNTRNVNYQAKISRSGDTLTTLPWGVKGFQTAGKTDSYVGKTYYVIQETTTPRATWAKIKIGGKELWVDIKALTPETMSNTKKVNYEARITRGTDTITSLPWGVKGFVVNANSASYLNTVVKVIEETSTPRATWAKIESNGKILGWIDTKALNTKGLELIQSSRMTDYQAKIVQKGHTLDTKPWGTKGSATVGNSSTIYGKTFKVEEVAVTVRATWAKIKLNGQYVWMDIKGLQAETMSNTVNRNYTATIKRKGDTITTLPWGIEGYKVTGTSDQYLNKEVTVLKETTTPRATWAFIQIDGKDLGWIDLTCLRK